MTQKSKYLTVLRSDLESKVIDLNCYFDEVQEGTAEYTHLVRVKLSTSIDLLYDLGLIDEDAYQEYADLLNSFADRLVSQM